MINFLLITTTDKKIVVRAVSVVAAKSMFKRLSDEKVKCIRKLRLTDLEESKQKILFLE
ncbi:hypothetical protein [Cytobacillus horneckiae]|uniref:hypothetical protein n=1 Tax=Cytobacillus horneckiae TaxID=549687 RepID=UPI003D24F2A5